jgi:GYF domain 2
MEEPEITATWFILHEGQRFGPFTVEQLKEGALDHELHPRYDMAWQEGMADWIPAGEVEGLFEKTGGSKIENEEQDHKKKKKKKKEEKEEDATSPFGEDEFAEEPSNDYDEVEWEGVSRGGYIFFIYFFPGLWLVGLTYLSKMLPGIFGPEIAPIITACLAFLPAILGIFAIIQRLDNLAMRRLWFLGLFAPILNLWLGYRLFACPPGYAEHKRLGVLGWILAFFYWLPLLAVIAVFALFAVKGPELFQPIIEKNKDQYEQFMQKVKEATETPEEKKAREEEQKAKEKAAKGPSIIPIRR